MLNNRTRELISALHKAMTSCDAIREREIKRDKAYAELEKKCNEAFQDLDKNPLVSDMRSEIETLQGQTLSILHAKVEGLESERERLKASEIQMLQDIDSLRQDRVVIVLKVVSDASMKLVHSDEMGVLIARLVRAAIIHDEYDRAGEDMANASYPFLSEFTSNPYAFVEQLLSMKPRSLLIFECSLKCTWGPTHIGPIFPWNSALLALLSLRSNILDPSCFYAYLYGDHGFGIVDQTEESFSIAGL
ncbi:hypothetical protein Tco_0422249 [Tanacetum coccineum]